MVGDIYTTYLGELTTVPAPHDSGAAFQRFCCTDHRAEPSGEHTEAWWPGGIFRGIFRGDSETHRFMGISDLMNDMNGIDVTEATGM